MGLFGVIVGAVITHLGNYLFWKRKQEYEAHQLARGLRGEIGGLLDLLEKRDYQGKLRQTAQLSRQSVKFLGFSVSVSRDFFKMYEATVERIGTLQGKLPESIARLYVLGEGVIESFNSLRNSEMESELNRLGLSHNSEARREAIDAWAAQLEGAADLIDEMTDLGREVVAEIERRYSDDPLGSVEERFLEGVRQKVPGAG